MPQTFKGLEKHYTPIKNKQSNNLSSFTVRFIYLIFLAFKINFFIYFFCLTE